MAWYNPFSWFGQPPAPPATDDYDDSPRFSRSARDSTDIPMDVVVTMRMSDQLRERGARKARAMGLSFGEYLRLLLSEDLDSPPGQTDFEKVIRKDDPASR